MKERNQREYEDKPLPLVLIVDRDEIRLRTLQNRERECIGWKLNQKGLGIISAQDSQGALKILQNTTPDIVVIGQINSHSPSELMRKVQVVSPQIPVFIMDGGFNKEEAIQVLERGASDYQSKDITAEELVARIHAILRKPSAKRIEDEIISSGEVEINFKRRSVMVVGEAVQLTATEWKILEVLCRYSGQILSTSEILAKVWGTALIDKQHIRTHICRMRLKLEKDPANPQLIKTAMGIGYFFDRLKRYQVSIA